MKGEAAEEAEAETEGEAEGEAMGGEAGATRDFLEVFFAGTVATFGSMTGEVVADKSPPFERDFGIEEKLRGGEERRGEGRIQWKKRGKLAGKN